MIFGRNLLAIGSLAISFLAVLAIGDNRLLGQVAGAAATPPPAAPPAAPPASGKYKIMPASAILLQDSQEGKKTLRNVESTIAAVLRGSEPLNANTRTIQGYYGQYFFARLTHPEYLDKWPESRQKLLVQQLGARTIPRDVHQYLLGLTQQIMTTIIRDNYHPVARANAMLLLGSLNAEEAVLVGDAKNPPVPEMAALGVMYQELKKPEQSDAVRAAAMAGIQRHVWIDGQWPAASRRLSGPTPSQKNLETAIVNAMLEWINAKEAPEGRSQGGHDWLRRRAIEIVGLLGSSGQGNSVVTSLENMLADNDESLSIRCAAAEALGNLNLPQDGSINAKELAAKIATIAVLACRTEILRVEDQIAKDEEAKASAANSPYGGGGYGEESGYGGYEEEGGYMDESGYGGESEYGGYGEESGYGGYGDMMGGPTVAVFNPLGYRMILTRRRIKSQLVLLKEGLVGSGEPGKGTLARAAEGEQKDYVNVAINGIDDIIAIIDANEETEMEPMIEKLTGGVQLLENNCEVVATLPGAEGDEMLDEGLLNPLGLPGGMDGPDGPVGAPVGAPETPASPAPASPAPASPAPASPAPASPAPASPAPASPPADEPVLGEVPTGAGPPE